MSGEDKVYTWEEVAQHNNSESLWMVIHDVVYDVTKFMEEVSTCSVYCTVCYIPSLTL